jgi:hypothetical protein
MDFFDRNGLFSIDFDKTIWIVYTGVGERGSAAREESNGFQRAQPPSMMDHQQAKDLNFFSTGRYPCFSGPRAFFAAPKMAARPESPKSE